MKQTRIQFFLLLFIFLFLKSFSQEEKLYVGTFTSEGAEGIYLCQFNASTGEVKLKKTFKALDNPSFLKVSPDRKKLIVVNRFPPEVEPSGGYVSAYSIESDGTLQFINKQISHGAGPCHVDVSPDSKWVAIATYGGGTTSLYPLNEKGTLLPATSTIAFEGSGPNTSRQKQPHAHSVKFSPFNQQVFCADLGTDKLHIFELKQNEMNFAGQSFVKTEPGAGPRHFAFHPQNKIIYIINELNSTITAIEKKNQEWKKFQEISTLPANYTSENYCADIHVSPDGRFLYGSNRGHNSIAVFSIDPDSNHLFFIKTVPAEGEWPRNFTLSPDGNHLLVANQHTGNITVFKINPETGIPDYTGNYLNLPAPVCLEFLPAN